MATNGKTPDDQPVRTGQVTDALVGANNAIAGQLKETFNMVYSALQKGIQPKKMLQISDSTIEGLYTQGYTLYNQGKFKEASYIFLLLMMMDPSQTKHMLGSAACLHRMGKYEKAAQLYIIISTVDKESPLPHFHAADCYIKLKALPLADYCLKNAIQCCGDKKEFAIVKERASMMLKAVDDEIEALGGFPGIGSQPEAT